MFLDFSLILAFAQAHTADALQAAWLPLWEAADALGLTRDDVLELAADFAV